MLALLGLLGASAQPNLIDLECDTVQRGTPIHYTMTLNEAAGAVDWAATAPGWLFPSSRVEAQFTADAVSFLDTKISRTDLTIERDSTDSLGRPYVERGKCRLVEPVKRAF